MADKISYRDFFNFDDEADLVKLRKAMTGILEDYNNLQKNVKATKTEYKNASKAIVDSMREIVKGLETLNPAFQEDQAKISATSKASKDLSTTYDGLQKKIAELTKREKELTSERSKISAKSKELLKVEKETERIKAKLAIATSKETKELELLRAKLNESNKQRRETAKEAAGLVSIYQKESKQLIELRNKYKDVALQYGVNSREAKKLRTEITALDQRLKLVDANAGQFQRSVGHYATAMKGATSVTRQFVMALGYTGAIFAFAAAIRNAVKTVIDFDANVSTLAGVLGKARGEIKELTKEAIRLGGTTAKSASEVLELEIAYARLGFTQQEILNLTEDTINGSIALQAELGETAELTGAVVKSFTGLKTTDAGDILDQITLATQRSALNFEKLQTAIPIVAGAASAAGIPFTKMLALLGKLSDAGIDASMSATALRNIFIESAAAGDNYDEILDRIYNSQDQLTAANDAFGKRSVVSASILANLSEEVNTLDQSLQEAAGTAQEVADTQMEAMRGKLTQLTSAWEGWILAVENGQGRFARAVGGFLDGITTLLKAASQGSDFWKTFEQQAGDALLTTNESIKKLQSSFNDLNSESEDNYSEMIASTVELTRITDSFNEALQRSGESTETIQGDISRLASDILTYRTQVEASNLSEEKKESLLISITEAYNTMIEAMHRKSLADIEEEARLQDIADAEEQRGEAARLAAIAARDAAVEAAEQRKIAAAEAAKEEGETLDYLVYIQSQAKKGMDEITISSDRLSQSQVDVQRNLAQTGNQMTRLRAIGIKVNDFFNSIGGAILDLSFGIATGVKDVFNNFQEARIQQQQQRIEELNGQQEEALEMAGDNADARAAIEESFDKKREQIEKRIAKRRRKQAIADKAFALAGIAIDTAAGAANAASKVVTLPLVPFILGLGAAQAAVVLSTPIPAFAKGTDYAPGGLSLVGEQGREIVQEPNRKPYIADSATLIDLPQGSKVLNNAITENILKSGDLQQTQSNHESDSQKISARGINYSVLLRHQGKKLDELGDRLEHGIKSIPINITQLSERGVSRFTQNRGRKTTSLNSENSTFGEG